MERYFLRGSDREYGPFSADELARMRVSLGAFVRPEGSETWSEAGEHSELISPPTADQTGLEDGPYWGDITPKECNNGLRTYSAVLWGIPPGQSWEDTCAIMPAQINGLHFPRPHRCVNTGVMWGEWDVDDGSCGVAPPPSDTIPQCAFFELYTARSTYSEGGKVYPAVKVNLFLRREPGLQGACRCDAVGPRNNLVARLNAYETGTTTPARGFWVFRDRRGGNEFPFGTNSSVGYAQQIEPLFVPGGPSKGTDFEATFFLKGVFGARQLKVERGPYPVTPGGGVTVSPKR